MEAYARGDREAFVALYRSLAPRIHGFFLRRFGSETVAEDLLQLTFLKLHRARRDYRKGAPVRPWAFTIAARIGLDELRRRGRRPEDADEVRLERATQHAAMRRAAGSHEVERADVAARVREAVERLPQSQRIVVQLHRYQDLTFEEIGQALGTSEGAVKLRAFRAYERLRKELAPLMEEIRGTAVAAKGRA